LILRPPTPRELSELRMIADLQFRGYGDKIIPDEIILSLSPKTGKIRSILLNGEILYTVRAGDYRLILHVGGGHIIDKNIPHPLLRVYVNHKYSGFIAEGGNVFCKHVVYADPDIRPGDEVLAADASTGSLLGVGRAVKPGWEITYYRVGEAIRIREGVK
jgi:uncharacterized protein with predicted RNA binding PUA domain